MPASGSGDFDDEDFYPSPKPTEPPVEKGGMGCSTKFFDSETSAFFGCISSWWVCTIALAMFIIIGCVLPKVKFILIHSLKPHSSASEL